jgi:hypothetical protein
MKATCHKKLTPAQQESVTLLTSESFFCSDRFARLFEHLSGTVIVWLVHHNDSVVAALPGVEFGIWPIKRFQAMPDGCYGRLFVDEKYVDQRAAIIATLGTAVCRAGYVRSYINDFYGTIETTAMMTETISTQVVDISSPNWQPEHESLWRGIRKAEKENVAVVPFDPDCHMAGFLSLMTATEKRHRRSPKYPPSFYTALAELTAHDERLRWSWCERDGQSVASHIYVREGDMLLYWQGYFDPVFSSLRPNQYMMFLQARECARLGVRYLNLGASPPDADSLQEYKERWGGEPRHYKCYTHQSPLGKILW